MRSRSTDSRSRPQARASSTPSTWADVLYSHRSPGWYMSGSDPSAAIHASGSWATGGQGGPPMLCRPSSASARWIG